MEIRRRIDKWGAAPTALTLLLMAACASNPDSTAPVNHAPTINSLTVGGGRPGGVGAGDVIQVSVETSDIDGDELSYVWTPEGQFSGSGRQVSWLVPDDYGVKTLACTVSDGHAEDSMSRNVSVGRLIDPATSADPPEGEWRWDGSEGEPFYILDGSVEIGTSTRLVIAGGTTVWCNQGSKLKLTGGLRVEGTSPDADACIFKPWTYADAPNTYWEGIEINSPADTMTIQGLFVQKAKRGLNLTQGQSQEVHLLGSRFESCEKGIEANFLPLFLDEVGFEACGTGIHASTLDTLVIEGGSFTDSEGYALYAAGSDIVCTGTQFISEGTALFLGTGGELSFTGNVFLVSSESNYLAFGVGFSGLVDFRCNYWGSGVSEEAEVLPRILRPDGQPTLLLVPIASTPFEDCGL